MKIIIKRDTGFADNIRAYRIVLDGKEIGEIRDNQEKVFEVQKGAHQLNLKIDWTGSNKVDFTVEDQDIVFECGSNFRGIKVVFALFYLIEALFNSSNWIWLKKIG